MTNLEWLAKMPRDEAEKVLDGYCPFALTNDICVHCYCEVEGTCQRILEATHIMGEWLLAEREEHDAEH